MLNRCLAAALILVLHVSSVSAEIYLWPLHGARRLSSSFGEFREGHYHAGVDLRTFGRTGLPCMAVERGEVRRLKIGPAGYGKALYLKLDDGRTAVYAHLHGFTRELDSLAYHWRLARGRSWCDIHLPPGSIVFDIGDTLAFTGVSGTSAPHLHFEMRDREGRPFNPLESIYEVPDGRSPIMSGLEVVPLTFGSLVNGSPLPRTELFRASGRDMFVLDDTLQLEGSFGFGLAAWDEQGYGSYRMAPLSVELYVDGDLLYSLRNRRFDYSQNGLISLEYDRCGGGKVNRYLLLFKKDGNSMDDRHGPGVIHSDSTFSGGLLLEEGVHIGEVAVKDSQGNESRAVFRFTLHRYPVVSIARKLAAASEVVVGCVDPDGGSAGGRLYESGDGGRSWGEIALGPFGGYRKGEVTPCEEAVYRYVVRDDEGVALEHFFSAPPERNVGGMVFSESRPSPSPHGLYLRIVTDRILSAEPRVVRLGGEHIPANRLYRIGPMEYIAAFARTALRSGTNVFRVEGRDHRGYPLRTFSAFRVFVLESGDSAAFTLPDSLHIELRAPSLRGPASFILAEVPPPAEHEAGLELVSRPFSIDFPADRPARPLVLRCNTGGKVGLFSWKEGKGWECVGVPAASNREVEIDRGGVYAFFMDGLPPILGRLAVEESPVRGGFFKKEIYYVQVDEPGCGVDPFSARAVLSGSDVVCEWDEFRKRLYVPVPESIEAGAASLEVEIRDRAGNTSAEIYGFMLK